MPQLSKENQDYLAQYLELKMGRSPELFTVFLPKGYQATTLSSVSDSHDDLVQSLKWQLGLLITLTDDFSDHPTFRNLDWTKGFIAKTYGALTGASFSVLETGALVLASALFASIRERLKQFAVQSRLVELILFDCQQYFTSMYFASLIHDDPILLSKAEYLWYAPHNMGMVIAGMIDLCFSKMVHWPEMAKCRKIFYHAQRYGHICNTLTTLARERAENSIGNEITLKLFHGNNGSEEEILKNLNDERHTLKETFQDISLQTFSCGQYIAGIASLHNLHDSMEGVI